MYYEDLKSRIKNGEIPMTKSHFLNPVPKPNFGPQAVGELK